MTTSSDEPSALSSIISSKASRIYALLLKNELMKSGFFEKLTTLFLTTRFMKSLKHCQLLI
jgi:hypothetical protein